jgi:hypothetical protein
VPDSIGEMQSWSFVVRRHMTFELRPAKESPLSFIELDRKAA